MTFTDALAIYGAILSTTLLIWQAFVYLNDRHKVALEARFIPEVGSFVIEIVNVGRRPITIAGGGLGGLSEGYRNRTPGYSWPADAGFPRQLSEGDGMYVQVWWGDDVEDRNHVRYAWARDARGSIHTARLRNRPDSKLPSTNFLARPEPTPEELAKLFNSAAQLDDMISAKAQLAFIELEIEMMRESAQPDVERKRSRKRTGADDENDTGTER